MHFSFQHLVIAFLIGALAAYYGIYHLLDQDGGLSKAIERQDKIKTITKEARDKDLSTIKKQKREIKPIEKKITKINKKLKKELNSAEKIDLQKEKIAILEEENKILKKHNAELVLRLEAHHKAEEEALSAISANLGELQREKAKNKGFVIGMSVGVPLAVVAGAIAGFYLPIKR